MAKQVGQHTIHKSRLQPLHLQFSIIEQAASTCASILSHPIPSSSKQHFPFVVNTFHPQHCTNPQVHSSYHHPTCNTQSQLWRCSRPPVLLLPVLNGATTPLLLQSVRQLHAGHRPFAPTRIPLMCKFKRPSLPLLPFQRTSIR